MICAVSSWLSLLSYFACVNFKILLSLRPSVSLFPHYVYTGTPGNSQNNWWERRFFRSSVIGPANSEARSRTCRLTQLIWRISCHIVLVNEHVKNRGSRSSAFRLHIKHVVPMFLPICSFLTLAVSLLSTESQDIKKMWIYHFNSMLNLVPDQIP